MSPVEILDSVCHLSFFGATLTFFFLTSSAPNIQQLVPSSNLALLQGEYSPNVKILVVLVPFAEFSHAFSPVFINNSFFLYSKLLFQNMFFRMVRNAVPGLCLIQYFLDRKYLQLEYIKVLNYSSMPYQ